jgi:tetratricopeptide (TPR) repeat protein
MRNSATLHRFSAICTAAFFLFAGGGELQAQAAPTEPITDMATTGADTASQAELLKSYVRVQEELRAAQQALVNSRLEAEAAARAQTAAIAEKLEALKVAMAAESDRQLAETQRQEAERQQHEAETARSTRMVLWIAGAFGSLGSLAVLFSVLFQWRAMNRVAEVMALRPALPTPERSGLAAGGHPAPAAEAVLLSNQRLLSVIDRMERRIFELEHTATQLPAPVAAAQANGTTATTPMPIPAPPAAPVAATAAAEATHPVADVAEQATRISALLGKGRSLLSANKAREALACYDEILQLEANHPEALVKKGAALERLKQDLDAIECYDRAIKADRKMTLAYLSKGGICNRLQRYDEAVECYELALQAQEVRPAASA